MSGRVAVLLLLSLLGSGCGDSEPAPAPAPAEVKGTPFRREAPKPVPPEIGSLGDLDTAPPSPGALAVTTPAAAPPPASPRAPTPPAAPAARNPAAPEETKSVSFDDLAAFEYDPVSADGAGKREIPEKIRALSGSRVVLDGYMMPLQYEAGGAKKFLLMRNQFGCCYGISPKMNEWIEVTMEGGAVADYIPHVLVAAYGTLEVKEESKNGVVTSLYRMKGTRTEFTEAK